MLAVHGGEPVRRAPFPRWPVWDEAEGSAVREVLEMGIWSDADGPKVRELERAFAAFHDAAHAIAVTNGTISLEIAMSALGIGAGDEVIVPAYTFIATASAVLKVNALPIFADVDPETYCLDPAAAEAAITPRTRAMIPVHFAGHPADMDRLCDTARRHNIALIEDAAHAHGAAWRGRRVGAIGVFGSWSFQASKNMTAGEGGMITADDAELAERARAIHHVGRLPGRPWYEHALLGGNYRLTEWQSAVLLAQLARLPDQVALREQRAGHLDRELAQIEGIRPMYRDPRVTAHAHHLYMFRYDRADFGGPSRDEFVAALRAEGIPAGTGYAVPLNLQPVFAERGFDRRATGYDPVYGPTQYDRLDLPASSRACAEAVWLTQNVLLGTEADMDDVLAAVRKIQHEVRAGAGSSTTGRA